MTQKDVHNIFVKADMSYKAELIKQCDYDIEKIKQFENMIANICNASIKAVSEVLAYMNTEIKD